MKNKTLWIVKSTHTEQKETLESLMLGEENNEKIRFETSLNLINKNNDEISIILEYDVDLSDKTIKLDIHID